MTKQITYLKNHNGLSINTNEEKEQGVYTEIIEKHHTHLMDMIEKHSKVMQLRFDLHYPQDGSITPSNEHLHDFNYNLQRKLKREKHAGGHKVDPRLIIATEQHNDSTHPHMHGALLVNGNAKQNPYGILAEIDKQWNQVLGVERQSLVDYCDQQGENGIMIDRNKDDFEEKKNRCSHQASYLAKEKGKQDKVKGTWLTTGTRLPKK